MSANPSNTVLLKTHGPRHYLEAPSDEATGVLKPAHLIEYQADGGVKRHAIWGGQSSKLIAKEDALVGKTINDGYTNLDQVAIFACLTGDEVLVRVAAGAAAVLAQADLVSDGAGGVQALPAGASGNTLYESNAASSTISNTVTPTAFSLTATIPANSLQVGETLVIRGQGIFTNTNSTDTCAIAVLIGATTILTIPALDVATNDVFRYEITLVVRSISTTTCTLAGTATYNIGVPGTATDKSAAIASFTINSTIANVVSTQATWSVASASDVVRMDTFIVTFGRPIVSLMKAIDAVDNSGGSADVFISARWK